MPYPSELADRMQVRFPDGMRDRLKIAAAASKRSMNSEVIYHLERALGGATAATGHMASETGPAAAQNTVALQGVDITHGNWSSADAE